MQTFLPYPDFDRTAQALDYRRLCKQRVEAKQILKALHRRSLLAEGVEVKNTGWLNHPATLMWEGHELALCEYMNAMIREWVRRGYKNTMPLAALGSLEVLYPEWLGADDFHRAHQSNLLAKAPEFYNRYQWDVPDDLPYVWPVLGNP